METWGQRDTAGVREKKSKRKAVNLSALSLRDELLAEKTKQNKTVFLQLRTLPARQMLISCGKGANCRQNCFHGHYRLKTFRRNLD